MASHGIRSLATGLDFHSQSDDSGGWPCRSAPRGGSAPASSRRCSPAGRTARGAGYAALADRLRLLVLDGRLPVDVVLPSERELAVALGTSRTTTAGAYRSLRETGFAAAGQGAGTWTALPGGGRRRGRRPVARADHRRRRHRRRPRRPGQRRARGAAAGARRLRGRARRAAPLPAGARLRERRAAGPARAGRRAVHRPRPADDARPGARHRRAPCTGCGSCSRPCSSPGDRVLVESPSYPLALDADPPGRRPPRAAARSRPRAGTSSGRAGRRPRHRRPRRLPHARLPEPDRAAHGRCRPGRPLAAGARPGGMHGDRRRDDGRPRPARGRRRPAAAAPFAAFGGPAWSRSDPRARPSGAGCGSGWVRADARLGAAAHARPRRRRPGLAARRAARRPPTCSTSLDDVLAGAPAGAARPAAGAAGSASPSTCPGWVGADAGRRALRCGAGCRRRRAARSRRPRAPTASCSRPAPGSGRTAPSSRGCACPSRGRPASSRRRSPGSAASGAA